MNNIVQYRATTCAPQFVVTYRGWQYVDGGSTLKYHMGISVYILPWVLSEVCGVSGFHVFYLPPVQEEVIGYRHCGFQ